MMHLIEAPAKIPRAEQWQQCNIDPIDYNVGYITFTCLVMRVLKSWFRLLASGDEVIEREFIAW